MGMKEKLYGEGSKLKGFMVHELKKQVNVPSNYNIHELKLREEYKSPIENLSKTFEIRKEDDKTFKEGDLLMLKVIDKENKLTGDIISAQVEYVLRDNEFCKEGYVTMAIKYLKTTNMFIY